MKSRTHKHKKHNKRLLNIKEKFHHDIPIYNQVFMSKFRFVPNLSILDLLFNLGPKTIDYLYELNINQFHNN